MHSFLSSEYNLAGKVIEEGGMFSNTQCKSVNMDLVALHLSVGGKYWGASLRDGKKRNPQNTRVKRNK